MEIILYEAEYGELVPHLNPYFAKRLGMNCYPGVSIPG